MTNYLYEENKNIDSKFLFEILEQHTYEPMFLEIRRPRLKSELILFFLISSIFTLKFRHNFEF